MTQAFTTGASLGILCATIVAVLGAAFFRSTGGGFIDIGAAIRSYARGVLGAVSLVVVVAGFVIALINDGTQFYLGWLLAYGAGLTVYFVVRYGIFKSR